MLSHFRLRLAFERNRKQIREEKVKEVDIFTLSGKASRAHDM